MPRPLDTYQLTSLESFREHAQISDATDTAQDALIETLIDSVSHAIQIYTSREFVPPGSTAVARSFRYNGGGVLELSPYDVRSVTQVRVDTDTDNPRTLASSEYRLAPLPAPDGVYQQLHLRTVRVGPTTTEQYPVYRVVEVTGVWGFAAVPKNVELAANITLQYVLRTTSQYMSDEFDQTAGLAGARVVIPGAARDLLAPYRRRAAGH
jgi:hypothetical protein